MPQLGKRARATARQPAGRLLRAPPGPRSPASLPSAFLTRPEGALELLSPRAPALFHDVVYVCLDGPLGKVERARHLVIGPSLHDEAKHLALAPREPMVRREGEYAALDVPSQVASPVVHRLACGRLKVA